MFWWVFGRNHGPRGWECVIISERKLTGETRWSLQDQGFDLLWDSARSKEVATLALETGALVDDTGMTIWGGERSCAMCGVWPATTRIRATRYYREIDERRPFIPFYGWVCEQCAETNDDLTNVRSA